MRTPKIGRISEILRTWANQISMGRANHPDVYQYALV